MPKLCHKKLKSSLLLGCLSLSACNQNSTPSQVETQGEEKTSTTSALEMGAKTLQSKDPLEALSVYLDGFHFRSDDMQVQMEAHHYCGNLNEEVIQCVLYDGNTRQAKLVGIEYIISERLFKSLPDAEKKLWHSHGYEVKSGHLIASGIPQPAENALMAKIATTYGKTWHTWDTADPQNTLPMGIPHLMMGATKDGQIKPELIADRDQRFETSSDARRQARANIPMPAIDPQANAWEHGDIVTLQRKDSHSAP